MAYRRKATTGRCSRDCACEQVGWPAHRRTSFSCEGEGWEGCGNVGLSSPSDLSDPLFTLAEVQVAPSAGLRPKQRLCRHLHGLVPLPLLLCLQVWPQISATEGPENTPMDTGSLGLDFSQMVPNGFYFQMQQEPLPRLMTKRQLCQFACDLLSTQKCCHGQIWQ